MPEAGSLGVSAEDATFSRAGGRFGVSLGTVDSVSDETRTLTLFDRGKTPVDYTVQASAPWIVASQSNQRNELETTEEKVALARGLEQSARRDTATARRERLR